MKELSKRSLSLDILKILSMIMVILLHTKTYGIKGVVLEASDGLYWVVNAIHMFSLVAVNCFVLISGYFTSTSASSPKKLLKLWVQVELVSVGIYLVMCAVPTVNIEFGFGNFLVQALPIMSDQYWFFTCYFILMIIAPFLNKFINTMEQKEFKKCLLILLALFVAVPSINIFGDTFDSSNGYSTVWFVILYFVGAYLRRYPLPEKPYGIFYICISAFSILAYTALDYLNPLLPLFGQARDILYRYNSATVFLASVCLFLFFVNHPVKTEKPYAKLITKISSASFFVYLIHEHPAIRDFLWNDTVKLPEAINSIPAYLLRLFISVICIFVTGIIIGNILTPIINTGEKLLCKLKKK